MYIQFYSQCIIYDLKLPKQNQFQSTIFNTTYNESYNRFSYIHALQPSSHLHCVVLAVYAFSSRDLFITNWLYTVYEPRLYFLLRPLWKFRLDMQIWQHRLTRYTHSTTPDGHKVSNHNSCGWHNFTHAAKLAALCWISLFYIWLQTGRQSRLKLICCLPISGCNSARGMLNLLAALFKKQNFTITRNQWHHSAS